MRVVIQFRVSSVSRPAALHIATKNVDNPMLDLFCDSYKIHIVAAPGRTLHLRAELAMSQGRASRELYLKVIAVVLVEPLEALDQQEISRKP